MILLAHVTLLLATDWHLVWSEEGVGKRGTKPDPKKWTYDLGDGSPAVPGWGNAEHQIYTDKATNAFYDGKGHLVIRAVEDPQGKYTSARLKTKGKFVFTHGRVEARLRIPYDQGIWPAFWMLGDNITEVGWPQCGEVDILENFGRQNGDEGRVHATVHGPGYSGKGITGVYSLPDGRKMAEEFHVIAVEWSPQGFDFFVDGARFHRVAKADIPAGKEWVFNKPFYLLLNLAVGGSPAPVGYPDESTKFPQQMVIDYVRVYQGSLRSN